MPRLRTFLGLAFFAAPLLAQAPPLIEKIEVSVVNVDVTVTGRDGKLVRGLTRNDFEIFEDGQQQPITNFYAVEQLQTATATTSAVDGRFRRKVLVLIDTYSMTPHERNRALARLEEFINDRFRGGEYDWSVAAVDHGLRVLLPPTSDKAAIHDALNEIRRGYAPRLVLPGDGNKPLTIEPAARFYENTELWQETEAAGETVGAIAEATRAFGATTGKKIILLLSGQLLPSDWGVADLHLSKEIQRVRNRLIEEANTSIVNFYIVNPLGSAACDPSMYWIARETGGRLMPGTRVADSLRQFDAGSSNFYSLGYRPQHSADDKYHRIRVRVKKGNYALQYRDGYTNLPESEQLGRTLGTAFGTMMISGSAIPVTLEFDPPRTVEDGVIVPMKTVVPTDKLTFLPAGEASTSHVDIHISIFDSAGRNVWFVNLMRDANLGKQDGQAGTFVENTEVHLARGKPYRIVVAVHDQVSEAVGVTQRFVAY